MTACRYSQRTLSNRSQITHGPQYEPFLERKIIRMINKRSSFAHHSIVKADRVTVRKAYRLEKELMNWAFDFTLYSERSGIFVEQEIKEAFTNAATTGYTPTRENCICFWRSLEVTHRMESSLMVENEIDEQSFVKNPLTLRIKLYHKNQRQAFFEWQIVFGEMGRIYRTHIIPPRVITSEGPE